MVSFNQDHSLITNSFNQSTDPDPIKILRSLILKFGKDGKLNKAIINHDLPRQHRKEVDTYEHDLQKDTYSGKKRKQGTQGPAPRRHKNISLGEGLSEKDVLMNVKKTLEEHLKTKERYYPNDAQKEWIEFGEEQISPEQALERINKRLEEIAPVQDPVLKTSPTISPIVS